MQDTLLIQNIAAIKRYVYLFALTLLVQTVHMIEHGAQVIQAFVLNSSQAHGLIGQLDLEQVHFAFNILYFAALIYVFMQWMNYGSQVCRFQKMLAGVLLATVVVQGYHSVEHTVKLVQFVMTGVQGTPGILGMFFNGVWFHFFMNLLVFAPPVVVFFCAGLHNWLFRGYDQSHRF